MPGADRAHVVSCSAALRVHSVYAITSKTSDIAFNFSPAMDCALAPIPESITIIHIQQYPVWRSNDVSLLSVAIGMDTKDRQTVPLC